VAGGSCAAVDRYDPSLTVQSAKTIDGIESVSTLFPACFLALSILGLVLYPVTKARFNALTDQLAHKRAGEPYSTEGFEKLV